MRASSRSPAVRCSALFLPQLVKVFRERDPSGVSLFSWTIACLAATSWAAYGLLISSVPHLGPQHRDGAILHHRHARFSRPCSRWTTSSLKEGSRGSSSTRDRLGGRPIPSAQGPSNQSPRRHAPGSAASGSVEHLWDGWRLSESDVNSGLTPRTAWSAAGSRLRCRAKPFR